MQIKKTLYWNGVKAIYTGKPSYEHAGGIFYDYKLDEGFKAGKIVAIPEHKCINQ